ncbi:hypothetical protein [Morganella morganii]|uniref:hypothetical protein n=1 Tax=Morganella morganii TaxID=582 RepID=UPI000277FFA6|nr:hypothetical protein [Morganella morganii]EMP50274.1 hypothetical protein C790_02154 [Morganella morganii SC01]AVK37179.1 hypothetical protein CSB69_2108 [Morganella morganii]EKU4286679.1 hypothetical protein [Morganella morganii]EKU5661303.1 hypothetical protein [Morganella morganii]EKY1473618.1 hypothetical protein [Morganella morganii]
MINIAPSARLCGSPAGRVMGFVNELNIAIIVMNILEKKEYSAQDNGVFLRAGIT